MIDRRTITARESKPFHLAEPHYLDTANGLVATSEAVCLRIDELHRDSGGYSEPLILENTPNVLTIGGRCVHEGFGFYWKPYSLKPFFTKPVEEGGGKIELISIGDVPYMRDPTEGFDPDLLNPTMPAPGAPGPETVSPAKE
jgi:hypothetical protein